MKKKQSDTAKGNERERRFRDMRLNQGYLSFKRNQQKFGPADLWRCFDVLSMKKDVIELAQIKGPDSREEQKQIKIWYETNKHRLPDCVRLVVAYDKSGNPQYPSGWRIVVLKEDNQVFRVEPRGSRS